MVWFCCGLTEKQDYKAESDAFKQQEHQETHQTNEPENIHEVMYQMSMSSGETTHSTGSYWWF